MLSTNYRLSSFKIGMICILKILFKILKQVIKEG